VKVKSLVPDETIKMTFADYTARRDPVFERAVALAADSVTLIRGLGAKTSSHSLTSMSDPNFPERALNDIPGPAAFHITIPFLRWLHFRQRYPGSGPVR
jgi:hypothetical protein